MSSSHENASDDKNTQDPFDPKVLEHESPLSALYFLSFLRLNAHKEILETPDFDKDEKAKNLVVSWAHNFVNSLLLASAISISIIEGHDYHSLLSDYMDGLCPDFDKYLLKVPDFESQEELERFLELETEYVQALHLLPLLLMLPSTTTELVSRFKIPPDLHWVKFLMLSQITNTQQNKVFFHPDPSPSLKECWEQLKIYPDLENWSFDMFDVLYVAWIVFNPIHLLDMQTLTMPNWHEDEVFSALRRYSFGNNSANSSKVHNAREYYEYEFERLKGACNSILKSDLSKEEKKTLLVRTQRQLANAAKLVKRAYRFYEWLPIEISGKKAALQYYVQEMAPENKVAYGRHFLPYFNYGE